MVASNEQGGRKAIRISGLKAALEVVKLMSGEIQEDYAQELIGILARADSPLSDPEFDFEAEIKKLRISANKFFRVRLQRQKFVANQIEAAVKGVSYVG